MLNDFEDTLTKFEKKWITTENFRRDLCLPLIGGGRNFVSKLQITGTHTWFLFVGV